MPDLSILLVVATSLATILLGVGGYRLYAAAKRVEPKAWAIVVREALKAMESEALECEHDAAAKAAEAASMRAQITQLRGQISAPPAA